ncbi:methyl-accepting chemotaxis protein [Caballeronia telluris]|uniref:methyl-accepting chemotaxis protein n=1 Tax=Caballeronia telluris TaxID=326475 RepID=UPI000A95591A|nr:methyl-accepting chemotaxis protein [Caballeronia telluris]
MKRKALARIRALIEASAGRVHAGTELVTKAGEAIERMTSAVDRVTDIMDEIASASREQTRGIEQVDQAIGQMDEVTQQNAPLVKQAAAAAGSMEEQAAHLRSAMAVLKISQTGESATRNPVRHPYSRTTTIRRGARGLRQPCLQ